MGQRLIVTVKKNQEDICKIYYHWSAYTLSALMETRNIIQWIDECEIDDLKLHLIRCCERNGGGIRGDEYEQAYVQRMYPDEIFKSDGYSRTQGLIAISKAGMRDLQYWSEGDVEIDLDDRTVSFMVFSEYDSLEEYETERMDWDEDYEQQSLEDIHDIGYDLGDFDFEDIEDIIVEIEGEDSVVRYGNTIYEMIS